MVKVFFPSLFMRLASIDRFAKPLPLAKLLVPPKMTKTEIKEYLTKIYNIDIGLVNTANYLGKAFPAFLLILKHFFALVFR
jgi:hypothetical protein